MVNLEHKLTVDDLIVEYMMEKVKNGYEPKFKISEFMKFLKYFEKKYVVEDAIYDGEELFNGFFERKGEQDWSSISDWNTFEKINNPHMEMEYDSESEEYVIKANYRLSDYDRSIINTYFMDHGMGKFDDYNGKTNRIRAIIRDFLSANCEKRTIEDVEYDENEEIVGKAVAAQIITYIWERYVDEKIKYKQWPIQCRYIDKYLLDIDLAKIIGVESIKDELLELYIVLSKRISSMYHQDHNLKISTYRNGYLARANYDLLITGYEERMNKTFGPHQKNLDIDLSTLSLTESHELDGVYNYDEDPEIKATKTNAHNEKVKKIIKKIDKHVNNKSTK